MKMFILLSVIVFATGCQANEKSKAQELKQEVKGLDLSKKEEDCDDKAKKPIEIKEETISLSGNTGCSLDEVKP